MPNVKLGNDTLNGVNTVRLQKADGEGYESFVANPLNEEWHQCPEPVRNYLANVTYDPSDYSNSEIANYAPATPVASNTKPVGKTVGDVTYYNEVPNEETPFASTNSAGMLKPLDALRWINSQTSNVRDLGGWTCDGGTVKYGMLFRGGEPVLADKSLMVDEIGVKHELQLRGTSDEPQPYSLWGINYSRTTKFVWLSVAESTKPTWKEIFDCVFNTVNKNVPLYFHCAAGADRTGTVAVMLEALLGMSQSDIDKDYELTCFSTGTGTDEAARRRNEDEYKNYISAIKAIPLAGGLTDTFRNHAVSFVVSLGYTIDQINEFRTAMIDGNPTAITVSMDSYSVTKSGTNVNFDNNIASVDEYQGYKVNLSANSGYVISGVTVTMGGSTINAFTGEKVNLFRRITNTLTHCTTNNTKYNCIDGQSYGAIITADSGYTLDGGTISILVGGIEMAQSYYSNGAITIPNVSGDVVISVTAVPQGPSYTNLADPTSPNWKTASRVNSSGSIVANLSSQVTNAIYVNQGDVIRIKNCGQAREYAYMAFPSETAETGGVSITLQASYDDTTGIETKTVGEITNHWLRFTLVSADIVGEIIITKNEEITA